MSVFTILPLINACQLGREVGVGANCHFLLQGIAFWKKELKSSAFSFKSVTNFLEMLE